VIEQAAQICWVVVFHLTVNAKRLVPIWHSPLDRGERFAVLHPLVQAER